VTGGRWFNITALNAHAPSGEKSDDSKGSFCKELEQVFDHFPKCHMIILLEFNAKLGREDIFKSAIGNGSVHQDSNDNDVRIVNLPHQNLPTRTDINNECACILALFHASSWSGSSIVYALDNFT
jgi:hypothetical protein